MNNQSLFPSFFDPPPPVVSLVTTQPFFKPNFTSEGMETLEIYSGVS